MKPDAQTNLARLTQARLRLERAIIAEAELDPVGPLEGPRHALLEIACARHAHQVAVLNVHFEDPTAFREVTR